MSVAAPDPAAELSGLYGRYKALALAAAATVLLEQPTASLSHEVEDLLAECDRVEAAGGASYVDACRRATESLRDVLARDDEGALDDDDLEAARVAHRELRRGVWSVVPCEYVPCCAGDHHLHRS